VLCTAYPQQRRKVGRTNAITLFELDLDLDPDPDLD